MIRLVLVLIAVAGSAHATQDQWPALFNVVGVDSEDVLNVRRSPTAGDEIIGTLSADATDIEVVRPNGPETWGLVNFGEGSGWVSLAFLQRQPGQWLGQFPAIRQCFGTEPFWSLEVEETTIRLSEPDAPTAEGIITGRYASLSRRDRQSYRGFLRMEDTGPLEVILMTRFESCGDGMSAREYGIGVDMLVLDQATNDGILQSDFRSGCCTLSPPPAE